MSHSKRSREKALRETTEDTISTRPRRAAATQASPTTIERSSPDETRTGSIRLTVKSDPRKLKEATSGRTSSGRQVALNSRDSFEGADIVKGSRTRKKAIVEESSEEDEDAEEEFDEDAEGDEDEDAEGAEEDSDMEDADAEGEEDEIMEDAPPVPPKGRAVPKLPFKASKPAVTITPAPQLQSIEQMAMEDDDDSELSDVDEDAGLELGDILGGDAEGLDDDSEDGSGDLSEGATPDISKLSTRRQRAGEGELVALSNEAQKKKHLTQEEISMRRVEMARRRKNLSEKRNEEEKMDTINRLLKKQAPKRRRKADNEGEEEDEFGNIIVRPNKAFARYVQTVEGSTVGVPREWVEAGYVGGVFGREAVKSKGGAWSGRMVEVVE